MRNSDEKKRRKEEEKEVNWSMFNYFTFIVTKLSFHFNFFVCFTGDENRLQNTSRG